MTETRTTFNVPRGTAYITYQQIVTYASSFVYYVILIRVLSLSQIGVVSLLAAAMSVFTTLTQLSLPVAATRFISANIGSRDRSNAGAVAKTSLRILLILAGPGLALAVLASPVLGPAIFKTPDAITPLIVTFVASFLLDLTTLYGAYFLGLGLYAAMVYQNILYIPLSRGLGLVLAYKSLGPLGIPLGWLIGGIATLLLSIFLWKGKLTSNGNYPTRPLLVFSMPLFATALITLLQGWGDIALLQGILGQFGTTGAYYIVVSSVAFLSILWTPVAGALYPALSSSYSNDGPIGVSARLGVATRFINLTVLPAGLALAAVAPTAITVVYGTSLANQAVPFGILSATIIFTAQSLLLITTLQATGRTRHILGVSLAAVLVDLATIGFGATALGTTAGALGRALLALTTLVLAWASLRGVLDAPVTQGLSKGTALALFSASPAFFVNFLLSSHSLTGPLLKVPLLFMVFVVCYLTTSRIVRAFDNDDFALLENAIPGVLRPLLRLLERLLIPDGMGSRTRRLAR